MQKLEMSGGRRFRLRGMPSERIEELWPARPVRIPLEDRGVRFSELRVRVGDAVREGDPVASSPEPDRLQVLASVAGNVREIGPDWVEIEPGPREKALLRAEPQDLARLTGERARRALADCGLWTSLRLWPEGGPPALASEPAAVVVRCVFTEPFRPRGNVLLREQVDAFVLGLQALQKMAGAYAPIHLVLADGEEALIRELSEKTRGFAWLRPHIVERIYPIENRGVLAHCLELRRRDGQATWFVDARDVLSISFAIFQGLPPTRRYIVLGGDGFRDPHYVRVPIGMRIAEILDGRLSDGGPVRIIRGGLLTGVVIDPDASYVGPADAAIAAIPEPAGRPFLSFLRPGLDRDSHSRTFLSVLFPGRPRRAEAALAGERRACISCGYCASVCPVRLLPQWLWRYLRADLLDEAAALGLRRCVDCGLCSYVCPSKIELAHALAEGKRVLAAEEAP